MSRGLRLFLGLATALVVACGGDDNAMVAESDIEVSWAGDAQSIAFGAANMDDDILNVLLGTAKVVCSGGEARPDGNDGALYVTLRIEQASVSTFDPTTIYLKSYEDSGGTTTELGPGAVTLTEVDLAGQIAGSVLYEKDTDDHGTVGASGQFAVTVCDP